MLKALETWKAYRDFAGVIRDPGELFALFVTFSGPPKRLDLIWFEFQPREYLWWRPQSQLSIESRNGHFDQAGRIED
ncbi:MAG: hypothetical protein M2R45_02067 [Verrucomicrobia subdivision 3 bacterium]|nr:hypothetical protein [Limisphaerales bacterium]MCS1413874.1 hypothetical protein [Limisphaerales bacterium]